jgi:hypothetical protein
MSNIIDSKGGVCDSGRACFLGMGSIASGWSFKAGIQQLGDSMLN